MSLEKSVTAIVCTIVTFPYGAWKKEVRDGGVPDLGVGYFKNCKKVLLGITCGKC